MAVSFSAPIVNDLSTFNQGNAHPKPSGNFFTHLIPTLGGTGGAVGGAAIGSVAGPVGTLVGALLGGALGGGAGKVGENAVEHQALGNGVAGQALEQGVLGAGPLRIAKVAGAGLKAGIDGGLSGALDAAGQAATKPGLINSLLSSTQKSADQRGANALGVGIGDKIGSKKLTPDSSTSLQDFLNSRAKLYGGIQPGTPAQQAIDAQVIHNGVKTQLGNALQTIDRPVSQAEKDAVIASLNKNLAGDASLTGTPAVANNFQNQIQNAKTVSDLENIRMKADSLAYNKGGDLASSQAAAQAGHTRSAIDDLVTNLKPTSTKPADIAKYNDAVANYKAIKGDYQNSKDLLTATTGKSQDAKGIGIPILGLKTPAQATQGVINKTNGAISSVAGKGSASTANPLGIAGIAGRTVPTGLVQALTQASNTANMNANAQDPMNTQNSSVMDASSQNNPDLSSTAQQSASPYTQDNLMADIQRDPRNADKYIATYTSLDKIFNPAGAALTTNQKNEVVSQQKALDALSTYTDRLSAAGGGSGPLGGELLDVGGKFGVGGQTAANAHALDSQRIDIASAIAGSLNPRGTVSPVTARLIADALPTVRDTAAVARQKIQGLVAQIQSGAFSADTPVNSLISSQGSTGTGSGADLASVLSQYGYGQ